MRLEYSRDAAVAIEFAYALGTLVDFFWMMGIVGEQHMAVVLNLEVESAVYTPIGLHAILQFLGSAAIKLSHSHGSDAVVDVDRHWLSEFYILHTLNRRHKVESDVAVVDADVLSMEVAFVAAILINLNPFLAILFHLQSAMNDKRTAWLNECSVMAEALKICFLCAIDVEMVGIGGCDDAHPRTQPMERAVELVGFYHYEVTLVRKNVVCAVVLGYASKESIAIEMTLVHDVGTHG